MRPLLLIGAMLILQLLDSASTWYLLENVPGEEINPFIRTHSFASILFSPITLVTAGIVLACVVYAERTTRRMNELLNRGSILLGCFIFPLYYLLFKSLVVLSNFSAVLGGGTPVSLLMRPFAVLFDDKFLQLLAANFFLILLLALPLLRIAHKIYADKASSKE